jgi:hypothetical protein
MRKVLPSFAAALVVTGALASSAAANHSWGGYHWARTANPFTISLGDNVSSAWDSYLRQAASDWSADTEGNPLNAAVVTGSGKGRCKSVSGRVEVCSGSYGNNGWLGLATIWVDANRHITRGTTKMNDYYYSLPKYDTPIWRAMVVCQEVGHTFGLDHQDESGADFHTCMDYASNPDADNTHPNRHDYEELAIIYSHLDATTTIGRAAGSHGAKLVRIDRKSESVIVREFANGAKRITFVYWAR